MEKTGETGMERTHSQQGSPLGVGEVSWGGPTTAASAAWGNPQAWACMPAGPCQEHQRLVRRGAQVPALGQAGMGSESPEGVLDLHSRMALAYL